MKKTSNPVVFFGSGPVAEESLKFIAQHFNVELVITKPSTQETMKQIIDCPLVVASNKAELDEIISEEKLTSKIAILVDFGIIVSQKVINTFELGIVNSHFSLLPRWRGADPISFSILGGDDKTGVSLMLLDTSLDTGKLLTHKSLSIAQDETTPSLTTKLIDLSNQLLLDYLPGYICGEIGPKNQPHPDRATYSRKLTKDDGKLIWNKPALILEREIRAYFGWPGSYTKLGPIDSVITKARVVNQTGKPGSMLISKKELIVYCGQDALSIEKLKPANKKEMPVEAFLAGYRNRL